MNAAPGVSQAFYKALQPGSEGTYETEYSIANPKTGERLIVRALGQTYYNKEGKPVTIAGTTQDITVQRKMQIALETKVHQRTKELAEAIESLKVLNKLYSIIFLKLSGRREILQPQSGGLCQF